MHKILKYIHFTAIYNIILITFLSVGTLDYRLKVAIKVKKANVMIKLMGPRDWASLL